MAIQVKNSIELNKLNELNEQNELNKHKYLKAPSQMSSYAYAFLFLHTQTRPVHSAFFFSLIIIDHKCKKNGLSQTSLMN